MHIIIDADPIVYRAGFAAETHNYHVVAESPEGELVDIYFDKDEEMNAGDKKKAWKKEHPDYTILDDTMIPDVEPLAFALRGVKITIEACLKDAKREFIKANGCGPAGEKDLVTVLLSGPGNFRDTLATIKPYKGNRDDAYKPQHYQAIRDYLCNRWDARIIEGHEADDECSILAWMDYNSAGPEGPRSVVCTIDKDLDQIPVPHYDYAKKVYYEVDKEEGDYIFHKQTLCGDATDNIQGMFRVGEKAAEKMLAAWREKWEQLGGSSEDEVPDWEPFWWERTVAEYQKNIEKHPDKYPKIEVQDGPDEQPYMRVMNAEEAALENARLVFMQTYRGQLWTPPGQPDEETT